MNKESAAPLVAQQEPQAGGESASSRPTPIVKAKPADVKILLDMIQRRHIPLMDLLEVVRTLYPRCDKSLLSKCAHGDETGAMLRLDALKALTAHFAEDGAKAPTQCGRKKGHRIQCRVDDAVYEALRRRLMQAGLNTQDYVEMLILKDLKGADNEPC